MSANLLCPVLRSCRVSIPAYSLNSLPRVSSIGFKRFVSTKCYTKEHEWVSLNPKTNVGTIGITDYAQNSLGDVVFVELPKVLATVSSGESCEEDRRRSHTVEFWTETQRSAIKKNAFLRRLTLPEDQNGRLYMGSGLLERIDYQEVYSGTVVVAGEGEGVERSWDRLSAWEQLAQQTGL